MNRQENKQTEGIIEMWRKKERKREREREREKPKEAAKNVKIV